MSTQTTPTASATVTTADVDLKSSNEEESSSEEESKFSDAVDRLKEETLPVQESSDTSIAKNKPLNNVKNSDNFDLEPPEKHSIRKLKQSRTALVSNLSHDNALDISVAKGAVLSETEDLEEGEIIDIDDDSISTIEISDDTELEINVESMTHSDSVILIEDNDADIDINGNSGSKSVKGHIMPKVTCETKCSSSHADSDVIVIDLPDSKDAIPTDNEVHQAEATIVELDNHSMTGEKVRNKEFITELHSGNDERSDKTTDPNLSHVFKCDFCTTICDSHYSMTEHLKIASHFSASKVNRDRQTGDYKILDILVIMNKDNLYKETVAVCPHPTCHEICQTIYTCALHHRLKHDSMGKLTYGLADILQTTEFINPCVSMTCPVCHDSFNEKKASNKGSESGFTWTKSLTAHFRTKNHYPFDYMKGECFFICPDCHCNFKDLNKVLSHQAIHQVSPVLHDMKVIVIQLGEVRICELPETHESRDSLSASRKDMADKNANTSATTTTKETESPNTIDNRLFFIDRKPTPVTRFSDNPAPDNSNISVSQTQPSSETKSADEVRDRNNQTVPSQNVANMILQNKIQQQNFQAEALASENHENDHENRYVFLCDYCSTEDQDRNIIYQHLIQECHSSASTVLVDTDHNPTMLLKPMSIKNYRGLYKKVVAACPMNGCLSIFEDIYECSAHCKVFHGCNENIYGLREIVEAVEERHPANLVCNYCNNTFISKKYLNRHIKWDGHQPHFCRKSHPSMYFQFVCLYCTKVEPSYEQLIHHIENKHVIRAIDNQYKIQILLISRTVQKKWILPFSCDQDGEKRNIDMNLVSMTRLKEGKGKSVKRKIQEQIKKLHHLKEKRQKQN